MASIGTSRRFVESRGRAIAGSLWRGAGIAIIIALIMALVFWQARSPGALNPGVAECRVAYAHAKTAVESASVDAAHPATGPQKERPSVSCGTLRSVGALH